MILLLRFLLLHYLLPLRFLLHHHLLLPHHHHHRHQYQYPCPCQYQCQYPYPYRYHHHHHHLEWVDSSWVFHYNLRDFHRLQNILRVLLRNFLDKEKKPTPSEVFHSIFIQLFILPCLHSSLHSSLSSERQFILLTHSLYDKKIEARWRSINGAKRNSISKYSFEQVFTLIG